MVLGVDTDVLVNWALTGAPHHRAAGDLFAREIAAGNGIGLTQQTLFEFLHIVTDSRRFERPLDMKAAIERVRRLWRAEEVVRIVPDASVPERTCELLAKYDLGRKRILDTALAATLEAAGVSRLATLNARDFEIFPFLEVVGLETS